VRRISVLDRPFTEKDGDLTPTLKIKRPVVVKKHQALIDEMYAGGEKK